jgi:hypothetical protein
VTGVFFSGLWAALRPLHIARVSMCTSFCQSAAVRGSHVVRLGASLFVLFVWLPKLHTRAAGLRAPALAATCWRPNNVLRLGECSAVCMRCQPRRALGLLERTALLALE